MKEMVRTWPKVKMMGVEMKLGIWNHGQHLCLHVELGGKGSREGVEVKGIVAWRRF